MAVRASDERSRIRAARYTPGPGFEEEIEMTLKKLPPRKHVSMTRKVLTASSAVAALALFVVLAAPPIVRAAGQLYQRLFGQVAEEIEQQQALPEDQQLEQQTAEYWSNIRWHRVEGASAQFEGVAVSVASVSVSPEDRYSGSTEGTLSVTLNYSQIPPFDPSWVDFACLVEGEKIPMTVDEGFQRYYRDPGFETRSEEEWNDAWSDSNSYILDGKPTTLLHFKLDDWRWDTVKQLEIQADIGGQALSIPFSFDPDKARAQAQTDARQSLQLGAANYAEKKDQLSAMTANAVPVGLSGRAYGHDWAVSEMSCAQGELFFTVAFGGISQANPNIAGLDYWLDDLSVDGMNAGRGGSGDEALRDGSYSAIYHYSLARDPAKLPDTSLIAFTLELGDVEKAQNVAFRYQWQQKKVIKPKDAAEMAAWFQEAQALGKALYSGYTQDIAYDLTPLNLKQHMGEVTLTLTGAKFIAAIESLQFLVLFEGDLDDSRYRLTSLPTVTINGIPCLTTGLSTDNLNIPRSFSVCPPLNISEFAQGERVAFEFPLIERDAQARDSQGEPDVLRYEFVIDGEHLSPLAG